MRTTILRIFCLVLILSTISCAQMQTGGNETNAPAGADAPPPDAASNSDFYYDFDDILVPKEMELQTNDSFILETPEYKHGVMVFTGKVEMLSLTNFFINNMIKDNWALMSAFKSSRTILLFEKPNRYCIINLTDGKFDTLLEIWVSPKNGSGSQIISPQPEPVM